MKATTLLMALLPALAGSICLYLSSANQRWRSRPLPAVPARLVALALILFSLSVLWLNTQPVVAVFMLCGWLMLFLVALPHVAAWRHLKRES